MLAGCARLCLDHQVGAGASRGAIVSRENEGVRQLRRIRITGLCLALACVLLSISAWSARAAGPEWGRCVRRARRTGHYADASCQTVAARPRGHYEWQPGIGSGCVPQHRGAYTESECRTLAVNRRGKPDRRGSYERLPGGGAFLIGGGQVVLDATVFFSARCEPGEECPEDIVEIPLMISCESETGSGEAYASREVRDVTTELHHCFETEEASPACESQGAGPGEIQLEEMQGELGYIAGAPGQVGLLLAPAGGTLATFSCGTTEPRLLTLTGNGVISSIGPTDEMVSGFQQTYASNGERFDPRNVPERFEGGGLEALEMQDIQLSGTNPPRIVGSGQGPAAESATGEDTLLEGAAEIRG